MDTINLKVALYGGAFNPITQAHLTLVKYLLNHQIVDQVWVLPALNHPFKKHKNLFDLELCYTVFEAISKVSVFEFDGNQSTSGKNN